MLKNLLRGFGVFGLASVFIVSAAQAGIVSYTDRTSFEAVGSIAFNNDFEAWDTSSGFAFPGNPFTEQGVTYNNTSNLIVGIDSWYTINSNHIANDYWSPITGALNVVDNFDMFAFDFGVSGLPDFTLTLTSNLATYIYNLTAPELSLEPLAFIGFSLDAGEFFTGFNLASLGSSHLAMMDNVTLGNVARTSTATVPEPAGILLFGLALAGLCLTRKRQAH